jgi:CHRD domain
MRLRCGFFGLLLTLACSGCSLLDPYACREQARSIDAVGPLHELGRAANDTIGVPHGRGFIGAVQFRGVEEQKNLIWQVLVFDLQEDSVTAVHLHEGSTPSTQILLDFPIRFFGGPSVTMNWGGSEPYFSAVSYDTFFDRLKRAGLYIDVHTRRRPEGALRGELQPERFSDWKDALCS